MLSELLVRLRSDFRVLYVGPQHLGHPLCQGGTLRDEAVSVSQLTTVMKLFILIILIHWLSKALLIEKKKWIVSVIVIAFKAVLIFNQCCNKKLEQIVTLIINFLLKKNCKTAFRAKKTYFPTRALCVTSINQPRPPINLLLPV